jgi:hypothetical protein
MQPSMSNALQRNQQNAKATPGHTSIEGSDWDSSLVLNDLAAATLHVSHVAYLRNCFLLGKQSSAIRSAQLILDGAR